MQTIYETYSAKETAELGRRLGKEAKAGEVYTLIGDLGVGKTVFTKGIAEGLGITEPVNSPTYNRARYMIPDGCHFTILMYIGSVI